MTEGLDEKRADSKKVVLVIRDLDPLSTEDKVKVGLRKALLNEQKNPEVKVLNPNQGD